MSINPNWSRWIKSSVVKHFQDYVGGVQLLIEGQPKVKLAQNERFELRMEGPYISEESHNFFFLYIEINILISCIIDKDLYRIDTLAGMAASGFMNVDVYREGNGADDTGTLLGCLHLMQHSGSSEKVTQKNYGQQEHDVPMQQSSVEGHFTMTIHT